MSVRAVFTTMGRSTPATVSVDADNGEDGEDGYYRWRKTPGWVPNDPRFREPGRGGEPLPQNRSATAAKRARIAEYTRRRLAGESKEQAAAGIGISASTMGYYERAFKAFQEQQRGESAP